MPQKPPSLIVEQLKLPALSLPMPGQNLLNPAYLFAVILVLGKYAATLEDVPCAILSIDSC